MVYTWNKDGSLNNDINRPAGMGTPSAILKKKVISNLRITGGNNYNGKITLSGLTTPELYSGDEPTVIKVGGNVYQGNIDTMLVPQESDGMYFLVSGHSQATPPSEDFTEEVIYKTFSRKASEPDRNGIWEWKEVEEGGVNVLKWEWTGWAQIGNDYVDLVIKKPGIRMKYKSTQIRKFVKCLFKHTMDLLQIWTH